MDSEKSIKLNGKMPLYMATFIAGTVGGIGGVFAGHPFDTIKVKLQNQSPLNVKYTGTWNCFATILKEESIFGLYKGVTSPIYGLTMVNAFLFGVYGAVLGTLSKEKKSPEISDIFIAGSISGFLNSFISCPTELAKIQLQTQSIDGKSMYKGTFHCLSSIYQERGIRGCYRGLMSTFLRETPSYGVYFASYELLCRWLAESEEKTNELDGISLMIAGGLAGIASWSGNYPADVIKTVIQAEDLSKGRVPKYNKIMQVTREFYKTEGIKFFGKGFFATIVRAFPTNAVTFYAYTSTMRVLEKHDLI